MLLRKLGLDREACGNDEAPALNFSVLGLNLSSGILGDTLFYLIQAAV